MRTVLLCAAFAAALVPGPAASAIGGNEFTGNCDFFATGSSSGRWGGDMRVAGIAYASVVQDNPVTVDVTCELRVNGVTHDSAVFSGTVVVAGSEDLTYVAHDGDHVQLCTTVDFRHTTGVPQAKCVDGVRDVQDVEGMLIRLQETYVDPALCPVLAANAGSPDPAVRIDEQGDVYLDGDLWWDCPPYTP